MTTKTCPHCGAPEVNSDRWSRRHACGYTVNFDGPPFPCRAARIERLRTRTEALVRIGVSLDIAAVEGLDDIAWTAYLANAEAEARARREFEARAARLTELGDECSAEEAASLTDDQYAHRLQVAQQAQREREELARIQADEKADNDRLLRNTVRG